MRRILTVAVMAVVIGVGVGLLTAQLTILSRVTGAISPSGVCLCPLEWLREPRFAVWLCALFGAVAAGAALLVARAVRRHSPN